MATLGERLKIERQNRGVSIDELSAATRITRRFIVALEGDDYDAFPAPLFITGTIRTYAGHLGLNADELIMEYESQTGGADFKEIKEAPEARSGSRLPVSGILGGLVVLLLAWFVVSGLGGDEEKLTPEPEKRQVAPVAPAPSPEGAEPLMPEELEEAAPIIVEQPAEPEPEPEPVKPEPKKVAKKTEKRHMTAEEVQREENKKNEAVYRYRFKISAEGEKAWVLVVVDGKETRDMYLKSGQSIYLNGNESFKLTTGSAGALRISINGKKVEMKQSRNGVVKDWDVPIPK